MKHRKLYDKITVVPYNNGLKVMANGHCLGNVGGNTVYFDPNVYVEIFENGLIVSGLNNKKIYFDEEKSKICEVDYEQNEILFS